jgi:hypothetical protein
MSDDALIAWLDSGAGVELAPEETAAKVRTQFCARFLAAMNPDNDLGPTCEAHESAVARNVYEVHADLCKLGIDVYEQVWGTMSAPTRSAIKKYVAQGKP